MKYKYETCCVNSTAILIDSMTDRAREITFKTFIKHVSLLSVSMLLGYDKKFPLRRDFYVRYYKSVFNKKPCYYVVHSAIEYIFTNGGINGSNLHNSL